MLERKVKDAIRKQMAGLAKPTKTVLDVGKVSAEYTLAITDGTLGLPVILDAGLVAVLQEQVRQYASKDQQAYAIYSWIEQRVAYKTNQNPGYRDSVTVLKERQGICGEMAYLYMTMARLSGIGSKYVRVRRDHLGKKVQHACATAELPSGRVLVDPAYHTYGIDHQEYDVLNDRQMIQAFIMFNALEQNPVLSKVFDFINNLRGERKF